MKFTGKQGLMTPIAVCGISFATSCRGGRRSNELDVKAEAPSRGTRGCKERYACYPSTCGFFQARFARDTRPHDHHRWLLAALANRFGTMGRTFFNQQPEPDPGVVC